MKFGILGAGSIGCYVGGMLASNGEKVVLVGRPTMAARLWAGYEITRIDGLRREIGEEDFAFAGDATALADCDVVFVCVKSGDSEVVAAELAPVSNHKTPIISLQNGIANADRLRNKLPGRNVLAAMVGFNVVRIGDSRFHCGTEGEIIIEDSPGAKDVAAALAAAGIKSQTSRNIVAVQWAKLLMNLNNAINVLSGKPLKAQLSDRAYRQALALSVREGLAAMRAARIRPARIGQVRPQLMPLVLELPDWLFSIAAANMLKIDETARSSMAEDLDAGRMPEVDFLNGEIVRLGEKNGVPTPVNAKIVELVKEAFAKGRSPELSGEALLAKLSG